MVPHLTLFFVVIAIPAGVAAISTVLNLRRRISGLLFARYALFLACFTLSVFEFYVFSYVRTNIGTPGKGFVLVWGVVDALTDMGVVYTGVLLFHELYRLRHRRRCDRAATIATAAATILTIGGATVSGWDYSPETLPVVVQVGLAIYYLLFLWMIVLNLLRIWRLQETLDRILGWSLFLFALTGIVEAAVSLTEMNRDAASTILPHGFYVSTIPWFLICLISIVILPRLVPRTASPISEESLDNFALHHGLSAREREVLVQVLSGKNNRAIADTLFVSLPTVKSHMHNILRKTNCRGRFELSVLARTESV